MPALTMDTMTVTGTMMENRMCGRLHRPTAGMLSDGLPTTPTPPVTTIRTTDPSGGDTITTLRPGGTDTVTTVRMPCRCNGTTTTIIIRPIRNGQLERVIFSPPPYSSPVWF